MGLETMDLHATVNEHAVERGFMGKEDTYFWGILAIECESGNHLSEDICKARVKLTSLAGAMYIMFSLASVVLAAIVGMLVLSTSPMLNQKLMIALYSISFALQLAPLIIFEAKLHYYFDYPRTWGVFDEKIHTTLPGVDAAVHIPHNVEFKPWRRRSSEICCWLAFGFTILSFVFFMIRVERTKKSKKYLNSINTLFMSRPSVAYGQGRSVMTKDVEDFLKPRRFSDRDEDEE